MTENHQTRVRRLDRELMEAYADVWREVGRFSLARAPLLSHLRTQTKHLRQAYILEAQGAPARYRTWLATRGPELDTFMTTLQVPLTAGSALKNAKRAWVVGTHLYTFWFLLIGVPAVATSLGAALLAIFHRCSCEIFWVALYTLMASVFVFVVIAFQFERAALLGDGSDRPNIYELEDRLFRELKFPRRVRVQWDVLGLFGIAAIILAAGQVVHAFDGLPHHPKFQYSPLVGAVPWMVLGALFLIFSLRRPWGWRAADSA